MNTSLKYVLGLSLIGSAFALGGCASIITGVHQKIALSTSPEVPAYCTLTNDKGTWKVAQTPAVVKVHKSINNLNVVCHHAGYYKGIKSVPSSLRGMVAGNLLFGGLIGAGVDSADGAAFDYPSSIVIGLHKKGTKRVASNALVVTKVKSSKKNKAMKKTKHAKKKAVTINPAPPKNISD